MNLLHTLPPLAAATILVASACGDSQAPVQVQLPVIVDATGLANTTTDLGYSIELTEARIAMGDLRFMSGEDEHTSLPSRAYDLLIPSALAHPGHGEGGEVHGELPGEFEVDVVGDAATELGLATLLATDYTSATFTLGRLSNTSDTSEASIRLGGTATREGNSVDFTFEILAPAGREITGIRFDTTLPETPGESALLRFRMVLEEVFGQGHVFDGVDFEALATGGVLSFGATDNDPIYLEVRRRLLSHDHVEFQFQEF